MRSGKFKNYFNLFVIALLVFSATASAATYYVDATDGDDSKNGRSEVNAWQTLSKVSGTTFSAGDSILFQCGESWDGQLWPKGSGSSGSVITIDHYGDPNNGEPIINGDVDHTSVSDPNYFSAVYFYNQEYWDVNNLEITCHSPNDNPDDANGYFRRGVGIIAEDAGQIDHFYLYNLEVHNVSGSYHKKDGGGIFWEVRGSTTATWFNDILIDNCYVHDVNRTGISNNTKNSKWWRETQSDPNWYPMTNFVMRDTTIERAAYNGSIIRSADSPLIEYCTLINNGLYGNGNAIFIFNTDDAIIQYCEAYDTYWTSGTNDAGGFDTDGRNKSSIIQYNYSHDNGQGGIVSAVGDGMTPEKRFNTNSRIRYNILEDNDRHVFRLSGPPTDMTIHNNVVYLGAGFSDVMMIYHKTWNGAPDNTSYINNIFYNLSSNAVYNLGTSTNNTFDSNIFYGNHPGSEPSDANKLTSDPNFVNVGSGGDGMDTVDGYKLNDGSPAVNSGVMIDVNNGGFDYWANPVPFNSSTPDRGAYEADVNESNDTTVYTLNPEADAYVRSGGSGDTNYGTDTSLLVKYGSSGYERQSYLRFDLSTVSGTVTSATLELKVSQRGGASTHDVNFVSNDTWIESGGGSITWNNKPSSGATLDSDTVPSVGSWIVYDVNDQVGTELAGNGKISFLVLAPTSTSLCGYHSVDYATAADRPKLIVTTSSAVELLPGKATSPSPANSATDVTITTDLGWTADVNATSHDVYFGTTSPGSSQGNQGGTTFDTGTMTANTVYYWRIDEVSGAGTTTGDIWSFTTLPVPGAASSPSPADSATGVTTTTDLSWTAGSDATSHDVYFGTSSPGTFQGNQGGTTFDTGNMTANTVYYWRIDEKNSSGTTTGTVWSFTTELQLPGQASSPSPADSATDVTITTDLSWTAGSGATSHDVYFGTDSTPDAGEFQGNQGGTTFDTGTMTANTVYYWRIDEKNGSGTTTGTVWSFTTLPVPGAASSPSPADSATDVTTTTDLSWTAGSDATSHDVYFGTSSPGTFQGNQGGTTFDTGTMTADTTYYWRIDEKNSSGTTTGTVWSFTTATSAGGTFTLDAEADSYVYDGSSGTNYGTETIMTVKAGATNYNRRAYLRYDLSSVTGSTVTSAQLKLKVESRAGTTINDVNFVSTDGWVETSITWNNKPSSGANLDSQSVPAAGNWIIFDVNDQVGTELAGDDTISFMIYESSANKKLVDYYTRDYGTADDRPKLVIVTE